MVAHGFTALRHTVENKANLDYNVRITLYTYLLCGKTIWDYYYGYLITSRWMSETLKILSVA